LRLKIKLKTMTYKDYIKLGFKRVNLNDSVAFEQTGNEAYVLEYEIDHRLMICAHVDSKPRLYYKHNFMCEITIKQVEQIINLKHNLL
jgi:hypothetical protein